MVRPLHPRPSAASPTGVPYTPRALNLPPDRALAFTAIREEIYVLGGSGHRLPPAAGDDPRPREAPPRPLARAHRLPPASEGGGSDTLAERDRPVRQRPGPAPVAGGDGLRRLGEIAVDGSGRLVEVRPPPRRSIPRPYLRPELCRFSRAEVLYDMCSLGGTLLPESRSLLWRLGARLLRLVRRSTTRVATGRHLKKWRHLLRDRTPEERLWEVTPPKGFAHLTVVRRWAEKTLADAGYDPERMLIEWEVLWRRRGSR